MAIYNKESLLKLFEESRKREEQKRQIEKQRYKELEKQRKDKPIIIDKYFSSKSLIKIEEEEIFYTVSKKYIEKTIGRIDDLYLTREELKEAEKRFEGRINWDAFDKLVKETKELINGKLERH